MSMLVEGVANTAISAVCFGLLFGGTRVFLQSARGWKRQQALQFSSRLVAMAHSVIVGLISAYDVFFEGGYAAANAQRASALAYLTVRTPAQLLSLPICCGYLLYDNYPQLVYKKEIDGNYEMIFHHWIGIPGLLASMSVAVFGYWVSAMLCFELSTPFLHLLYFLPIMGVPRQSPLYKLNAITFVFTFFFFRVVGSLLVLYKAFVHSAVILAAGTFIWAMTSITTLAYAVLNIYWFYRIIQEGRKLNSAPNKMEIGGG